jgi:hypothetical protein
VANAKKTKTKPLTAKTPISLPIKKDRTMQKAGLVFNIILPGFGTLVAGWNTYRKTGSWQLILAILSIPVMVFAILNGSTVEALIGFPLFVGAWLWALATSIKMLKE